MVNKGALKNKNFSRIVQQFFDSDIFLKIKILKKPRTHKFSDSKAYNIPEPEVINKI
jgi:hypothetical protein